LEAKQILGGDKTAEVKVKKSKGMKIAYVKHVGAYNRIPYDKYHEKLFAWIKEKRSRPAGPPFGIFYDNPEEVLAKKCRSEIGVPIKGNVKSGKEIKVKRVPSAIVARLVHKGSMKDYGKSYAKLSQWIAENDYVWVGPSMEIYLSKPKMVGGELSVFTIIQVPVKKA
jgi:effector-binding domain-containing protein